MIVIEYFSGHKFDNDNKLLRVFFDSLNRIGYGVSSG